MRHGSFSLWLHAYLPGIVHELLQFLLAIILLVAHPS